MRKKATTFKEATGVIDYTMTNDYMFRAVLQNNEEILKALVCSVLHYNESEIEKIEIRNPIEIGESIDSKTYIMDLKVSLNNKEIINLEMQVENEKNWPERSLGYLCRSYDNLNKGTDYLDVKPAIHIGFIDFTLFIELPEFHATYMVQNIKNHNVYCSNFILKVIELNHVELATEEDIRYGIDKWARLFKCKTWEELKMCAGNNEVLNKTAETMFKYNSDEAIREQCEAREAYYARERYTKQVMEEIEQLKARDAELKAELKARDAELEARDAEIARLKALLESR